VTEERKSLAALIRVYLRAYDHWEHTSWLLDEGSEFATADTVAAHDAAYDRMEQAAKDVDRAVDLRIGRYMRGVEIIG